MKTTWKWIPVLAIAAAAAYAQADFPGEVPDGEAPPPPSFCEKAGCPGMCKRMPPPPRCDDRGPCGRMDKPRCAPDGDRPCPPPDCGMGPTEEERAEFAAFRKLCKDVRAETDEAKKAEMTEALRAKLGEMADRQHERLQARLAAAEKRIEEQKARLDRQLADLKAMIDEGEANRDEWIEEQCRCILSGERPPMRPHRRGECGGPRHGKHRHGPPDSVQPPAGD